MVSLFVAMSIAKVLVSDDCLALDSQNEINLCAAEAYGRAEEAMDRQWKIAVAQAKASDKNNTLPEDDANPTYLEALMEGQRA